MIIGCGIDLCSIVRIQKIYEENKNKENEANNFATRILTKEEYAEFLKIKHAKACYAFLAKRWAAKEAFAKATNLGLAKIGLQNICIMHEDSGKPFIKINNLDVLKLPKLALSKLKFSDCKIDLSISSDDNYAIAFIIISCDNLNIK